jgi:hypothetical protein
MADGPRADAPVVERRHEDLVGVGSARAYLISALGLTVLMVLALISILLIDPTYLDLPQVRRMSYLLAAIIVALFAGAGINVVNVLNGQQAMLMRAVAEKERIKGQLEGLRENPDTNIS